jgi:hypothetical protein
MECKPVATGTVFPAFIRATYEDGRGFADFERAAQAAGDRVRQSFDQASAGIAASLNRALASPINGAGALDLGAPQLRAAAAAASERAAAADTMALAIRRAAEAEGDYSARARATVAAAEALAVQHRQTAAAALSEAEAAEQVQRQLDQLAVAQGGVARGHLTLIQGGQGVVDNANRQRAAMVGVGQQLQDISVSLVSGQNPATVFAQQIGQVAFALGQMRNEGDQAGSIMQSVANFLSGPWGIALTVGAIAIVPLIENLFETEEAAKAAELGVSGFAAAQSAVYSVIENTNGALASQNALLLANARLTAINLREEAFADQQAYEEARRDGATPSWFERSLTTARPSPLGTGTTAELYERRRNSPVEQIFQGLERGAANGGLSPAEALQLSVTVNLRDSGLTRTELRQAIIDQVEAVAKQDMAAEIDRSLDQGRVSGALARPGRTRRGRQGPSDESQRNAAFRQREFGEDARDRLANIAGQFGDRPAAIEKVERALRQLDDLATDIRHRTDGAAEQTLLNQLATTRATVEGSISREFAERVRLGEQDLNIQSLRLSGFGDQAELLERQYGLMREFGVTSEDALAAELLRHKITADQYEAYQGQLATMQQLTREAARLDRAGQSVQSRLQAVDDIRSNLESTLAELPNDVGGAISGFVGTLRSQVNDLFARSTIDRLFGDTFDELNAELRNDPRARADRVAAQATDAVSEKMRDLEAAAAEASIALRDVRGAAANDNGAANGIGDAIGLEGQDIVVTGVRPRTTSAQASDPEGDPVDIINRTFTRLFERFLGKGSPLARDFGSILVGYAQAGPLGAGVNGLSALLGTESPIGRAFESVSKVLPEIAVAMQVSSAISSFLGGDEVKNGKFFGQFAPFLTPLLGSALRGSASISGTGDDFAVAVRGNSGRYRSASEEGAESVISTVQQIAERLGGTVDASRGSVSIGIRKGDYRVDPTGQGRTKTSRGAIDFGDDAEAAARAAALDLIADGVIVGLRAGTQRLIQAGKDLDAQLQKALDFESVFTRLKEYKDPVGAALDTLDKEFERLQRIFTEAGASTEEYAQLEELYGIERAKAIKEAGERVTASLQGLFDDLTIGNDALSLRTRIAGAQARYDPLAARVASGDVSAYDDFSAAARELLDLQRQYSGSTSAYFDLLDQVTDLTRTRIDAETNIASIAAGRASPFDDRPAGVAPQGNEAVVSAIASAARDNRAALEDGFAAVIRQLQLGQISASDVGRLPQFRTAANF